MTREAAKEMDRRCAMNWLNDVCLNPDKAFNEYSDNEIKMFAYDALVLLNEQKNIVRCKNCKHGKINICCDEFTTCYNVGSCLYGNTRKSNWWCADGVKKDD